MTVKEGDQVEQEEDAQKGGGAVSVWCVHYWAL